MTVTKACLFCREPVPITARICPHCQRALPPTAARARRVAPDVLAADVHFTKSEGSITVIGYLGIVIGVLMLLMAVLVLFGGNEGGAFFMGFFGLVFTGGSYLYARR